MNSHLLPITTAVILQGGQVKGEVIVHMRFTVSASSVL
jgi:hypothetical protein